MRKFLITTAILGTQLLAGAAMADETLGSQADGEAMVRSALALIKSDGPEKAYKVFTEHPDGAFKDRDLYVFVYDFTGNCLAQGANPKMLGKNLLIMKDADGNPFIKGMIDMVKAKGKGWYGPYKFNNVKTASYELKKSYCERGAGDTIVCVGVRPS
ncbi:cache domain-containing protein [Janthinobacterium sp.]|uniref:cache domain-containing protein n=1 Tax=Janthinobacterium sp. TaxID=1871054 RepID=UPI00293D3A74|nr:cache domain-containing protein [Janthinobacterium sp.]